MSGYPSNQIKCSMNRFLMPQCIFRFYLLIISILTQTCGNKENTKTDKQITSTIPIANPKNLEVKTIKVIEKPFLYIIQSSGQIEAQQQSKLQFKKGGWIQEILADNGQMVYKGQTLAQLDTTEMYLALQKALLQVETGKKKYEDLLIQHKIDLSDSSEISPELHQTFKLNSGLMKAELDLKEAQLNISNCTLQSPMNGIVADLDFKVFNTINQTDIFCTIYSPQSLELIVRVLESEISQIYINQKAIVYPLAVPGKKYEVFLKNINPRIDEDGLVDLRFYFHQPQGLLPGMNTQVEIQIPQKQSLVVPKDAIVMRSGRKVVFTEKNGKAQWNYVETGLENEREVEIIKGLEAGQWAIVSNNLQLDHDSSIKATKISE